MDTLTIYPNINICLFVLALVLEIYRKTILFWTGLLTQVFNSFVTPFGKLNLRENCFVIRKKSN